FVPLPAVSPTEWVPVVTTTGPVVPLLPTLAAEVEPSICRLNRPPSLAGERIFVTCSVPVWRVFVKVQVTFSPSFRLIVTVALAAFWVPPLALVTVQAGLGKDCVQPAAAASVTV